MSTAKKITLSFVIGCGCLRLCCTTGCLGEWPAFNEHYTRPIKRGQTKTADRNAVALGRTRGAALARALVPLMLRRTKQEQLAQELPDKFDRIVFCALTPLQVVGWLACLRARTQLRKMAFFLAESVAVAYTGLA